MKYSAILLLLLPFCLEAQRMETYAPDFLRFAKPGVKNQSPGKGLSIDYRSQMGFKLEDPDGNLHNLDLAESRSFKIKLPLVYKPSFTALLGFHRQEERYRFSDFNPSIDDASFFSHLNNTNLKTNRFSLSILKPLSPKIYTAFKSEVILSENNKDLLDVENPTTYRFNALVGFKRSENTEYGVGLYYGKSLDRTSLLSICLFEPYL